jgi:predicted HicB family RNase H-like nuclease
MVDEMSKKKPVHLYPTLHKAMKGRAQQSGISLEKLVNEVCRSWLEDKRKLTLKV